MTVHTLKPGLGKLHGQFSPTRPPALTIDPGDTVCYSTLDVSWGMEQHPHHKNTRQKFEPREDGPAMSGPVFIRGAKPGLTLAVHIEKVQTTSWGWTWSGATGLNTKWLDAMGLKDLKPRLLRWDLDTTTQTATSELGQRVKLRPFMGTLGLCPPGPGPHPGWFPGPTGGNMDFKEAVEGTILYLPIAVDGALVYVGDGHAAQGDGELAGSAIECPMDNVTLRFELHDDIPLTNPLLWTPTGWFTLAFHEEIHQALADATRAMVDRICIDQQLDDPMAALALASAVVDVRITQMVNKVCGAHAFLPHDAFLEKTTP